MSSTIEPRDNRDSLPGSHRKSPAPAASHSASASPLHRDDAPAGTVPEKAGRKGRAVQRMGTARRKQFLELLIQGASPQVACRKLSIPVALFWQTLDQDAGFASELQRVWDLLSYNVMAALYQAAIKGNGSAQQFWLKHRPPPCWLSAGAGQPPHDDLEDLSDAELLDQARTEAPDLAAEIAARVAAAPGRRSSAGFSQGVESSG